MRFILTNTKMFNGFAVILVLVTLSHQSYQIGKCPEDDGSSPTYYPDPDDCTRFYECNHGIPIQMQCPPRTVFDPKVNVCVNSKDGKCVTEDSLSRKARSVPEVSESLGGGSRLANSCPRQDGYWTTFLRDLRNCNRYYLCSNGKAILKRCPSGLEFNAKKLVCDYPSRAGCRARTEIDDVTEDSSSRKARSVPEVSGSLEGGSRLATICPHQDGYWTTFLRDLRSCNRYYLCSNGKAILKRCPSGLEFNAKKLVCDYPSRAGCRARNEVDNVAEAQPYMASESLFAMGGPSLAKKCPKVDGQWPTYLIDPTDCSRFYECSHGKPLLQRCPAGLVFSTVTLTCDKRENVNCNRRME